MPKPNNSSIPQLRPSTLAELPEYRVARLKTRVHLVCYDGDERIVDEPMCSAMNRLVSRSKIDAGSLHLFVTHTQSPSIH